MENKGNKKDKRSAADIIAEKFIEKLESGTIPWVKPWKMWTSWSGNTGNDYNGVNILLLDGGEYMTAKQIFEREGHINKGAKAKQIVHYKDIKKAVTKDEAMKIEAVHPFSTYYDAESDTYYNNYRSLKYYNVFHIEDDTDLEVKFGEKQVSHDNKSIEEIDETIKKYIESESIHLVTKGNQAFNSSFFKMVTTPKLEQFKSASAYYSTLFHELIHSTSDALKRDLSAYSKDKKVRAREELVAEIGAAYLMSYFNQHDDNTFENSAAYVKSWSKNLQDDTSAILYATPRAIEAANYILNKCGLSVA